MKSTFEQALDQVHERVALQRIRRSKHKMVRNFGSHWSLCSPTGRMLGRYWVAAGYTIQSLVAQGKLVAVDSPLRDHPTITIYKAAE